MMTSPRLFHRKEFEMEKKKAAPPVADINVTPMVDVMLVLLIIFMVITPMLTKGQSVDKVKTKNPVTMQAADKEDAILISVTRNGGVFLSPGNMKLSGPDQLPERVRICSPTVSTRRYISSATPAPSIPWWRMSSIICGRPE
jgi:biopolymer transport protein ExbD